MRRDDLVFIVDLPPVSLLRYMQPPVTETMTIPFGVGINIVGVIFFLFRCLLYIVTTILFFSVSSFHSSSMLAKFSILCDN